MTQERERERERRRDALAQELERSSIDPKIPSIKTRLLAVFLIVKKDEVITNTHHLGIEHFSCSPSTLLVLIDYTTRTYRWGLTAITDIL